MHVTSSILSELGAFAAGFAALYTAVRAQRAVTKHLTPNGGSSLRDVVDRIEQDIRGLRKEISDDRAASRATAHRLTAIDLRNREDHAAIAAHLGIPLPDAADTEGD